MFQVCRSSSIGFPLDGNRPSTARGRFLGTSACLWLLVLALFLTRISWADLISADFQQDVRGHPFAGLEPNEITNLGIARTFQNVRLFSNMTVLENIMVSSHTRTHKGVWAALLNTAGFRREEKEIVQDAKEVLSFFGTRLSGYRYDQPAFVLSYANRRRLEIARAMATKPDLLLLDEPTAGMNPKETEELTGLIRKMRDERGYTIVVIEHAMPVVRDVSDRVVVLDHGIKIAEGSYDDVSHDPFVVEAYLGSSAQDGG